jgi:hypothetical protein
MLLDLAVTFWCRSCAGGAGDARLAAIMITVRAVLAVRIVNQPSIVLAAVRLVS